MLPQHKEGTEGGPSDEEKKEYIDCDDTGNLLGIRSSQYRIFKSSDYGRQSYHIWKCEFKIT